MYTCTFSLYLQLVQNLIGLTVNNKEILDKHQNGNFLEFSIGFVSQFLNEIDIFTQMLTSNMSQIVMKTEFSEIYSNLIKLLNNVRPTICAFAFTKEQLYEIINNMYKYSCEIEEISNMVALCFMKHAFLIKNGEHKIKKSHKTKIL